MAEASRHPAPALTVAAVARRLGVAPATLRTWDRRYGLGPSEHAAGSHRRYSPLDLARLETMRRLTQQGVAPGEAARVALAMEIDESALTPTVALLPVPEEFPPSLPELPDAADHSGSVPTGGGRVVPLPGGTPATRGLARAAMALDATACTRIIGDAIARRGVVPTWDELVLPVLVGIGERWELTGEGVEVEHLLSDAAQAAMRPVIARLQRPINARPVLLASAEEEQHSLPLYALGAALAERHVVSRILGSRVPRTALSAAIRRSGPSAIFLWSQLAETGTPAQLSAIPGMRPAPVLVLGGPGWRTAPPTAVRVADLTEAVTRLAAAAGA